MAIPVPWYFLLIALVTIAAVVLAVRARNAGHLAPAVAWGVITLGVIATILLFVWPILPFVDGGIDDGMPLGDADHPVLVADPAGAAALADSAGGHPAATSAMATYLAAASAADLFEVQSGELAMRRGRASSVRNLGKRLAIEHRQSAATLSAIAGRSGLKTPPPALEPQHGALLRQLDSAGGDDFDRLWISAQIRAHKAALRLHTQAAQSLSAGQMASFAKAQAQKVTTHLEQVQSVARTAGAD